MASRFGTVEEEGIDELKELSENKNTKESTEQWENVFVKWAIERGKEKNLEAYECVDLDTVIHCRSFMQRLAKKAAKTSSPIHSESCKQPWSDT